MRGPDKLVKKVLANIFENKDRVIHKTRRIIIRSLAHLGNEKAAAFVFLEDNMKSDNKKTDDLKRDGEQFSDTTPQP